MCLEACVLSVLGELEQLSEQERNIVQIYCMYAWRLIVRAENAYCTDVLSVWYLCLETKAIATKLRPEKSILLHRDTTACMVSVVVRTERHSRHRYTARVISVLVDL